MKMKWYSYLICGMVIFIGIICFVDLFHRMTATGFIRGSIDINNRFVTASFRYVNTSGIALAGEDGVYEYRMQLLPVEDFDGIRNQYYVTLNEFILFGARIDAGGVLADFIINFYDTQGANITTATMHISIRFLANQTVMVLTVEGSQQAQFIQQYFRNNGIRLLVNQTTGGNS